MKLPALVLTCLSVMTLPCFAQNLEAFHPGTAIPSFGKIASVDVDVDIPKDATFKISFDVSKQATPGEINRTLDSAARFINMHVAAGVPRDNINVAIVVHGRASTDLTNNDVYKTRTDGATNVNVGAIATLLDNNTNIYLCGQTAAYYGISNKDLVPGVKMALSAMTVHALLDQQGYTLNPF